MDLIYQYALFLAKSVTIIVAIAAVVILVFSQGQRKKQRPGTLQLTDLGEYYRDLKQQIQHFRLDQAAQRLWLKEQKKQEKDKAKRQKQQAKTGQQEERKPCVYVIDFKGSMDAKEVTALREEVSLILSAYQEKDEVLLRLESPGGVVHGYGLAASQLSRLRQKSIPLTVAVDKVAASGGYMMACVAQHIVAAPFAVIGSIGVVAQLPNFHRLLKKNDVDVELITAGEFKRTLTIFGENTEKGREKFTEEINQTHQLFKHFVQQQRPSLDINQVATGEHWFGSQAKELGLVDEIGTSDDLLLAKIESHDVIKVCFTQRKNLIDKVFFSIAENLESSVLRWWQRGQQPGL